MACIHTGILLLSLAAFAALSNAELSIGVDISEPQAQIGDDIQVRCHVLNEGGGHFYINWVKKVKEVETEIGTVRKINQPFDMDDGQSRYSATIEYKKDRDVSDVTFVLTIKQVSAMDSGELGCKIRSAKLEVFKELVVMAPFSSLSITSKHLDGSHHVIYANGESVEFDEGERRHFYCQATGGYPTPKMVMSLDDKDMKPYFNTSVALVQTGLDGLKELTYDIEMANPALEITYEFNRKNLKCSASIPGTEFKNSTSIDIKLNGYKPQFICDKVKYASLHQEDVNLTCRVIADPPINETRTQYYWQRESSGNDTIIPGEMLGNVEAVLEPGETDNEWVVSLRIKHIFVQFFRTYYFDVTNELGSTTFGIELKQDPNYMVSTDPPVQASEMEEEQGPKDVDAASNLMATWPLLVLLVISLLLA